MAFVRVYLTDSTGKFNNGTYTDINGYGEFKIPKNSDTTIFYVKCVGYMSYTQEIQFEYDYKFTISLIETYVTVYPANKKMIFKIKNIRKNQISLKKSYKGAIHTKYNKN